MAATELDPVETESERVERWRAETLEKVGYDIVSAHELAHRPDVPCAVVLDEAVELAKAFGTDESGAFVNGVLNRVAETLGRRDAAQPPEAG